MRIDDFSVPAQGEFPFVPGRHHIMLEKPTRLITPGDNARVLFFADDGGVSYHLALGESRTEPLEEVVRLVVNGDPLDVDTFLAGDTVLADRPARPPKSDHRGRAGR